ncbi:MAG: dimethylargininase [Chloroflexota bacterium]
MPIAITRAVSPAMNQCELTNIERVAIDLELAGEQHRQYEQALASLGCMVISLPAEPDLPDSVFVEDTALVLDECVVITRPGAESRRPESESIARALAPYRQVFHVQAPGVVDGGDILRLGKAIYVGLTTRSNESAIRQMQEFLAPLGYTVKGVEVSGCLHLKSAVTQVAADILLINPQWVDKSDFPGMRFIDVHPEEPHAANAVWLDKGVIYPSAFPKTRQRLEAAGIALVSVDASEVAKAEGAVTCCSLIFAG